MELTSIQVGWLILALALGLMFLGFPVAVTMLLAGFLGMWLLRGPNPALWLVGIQGWRQSLNEVLVIIPLYTWMGMMAGRAGIGSDAFDPLNKWVGKFRGGLTMAVASATAAFSAISGNHIACAVAMSRVCYPELKKRNYDPAFSLAAIAASANLDIMIPPSGSFILYGFLTMTPITLLFIAGILPGIFMWGLIMLQIVIQVRINPSLGPAVPMSVTWGDRLKSTLKLWPIVAVFVIVMGGIYFHILDATEAACFGCFFILVISVARRRLNLKGIIQSLQDTLPTSAMIMLMLICAWIFSGAITTSYLPQSITDWIVGSGLNRYAIMGLIMLVYIIAGTLTDIFAVMVVTLPIFFPVVMSLGFDPYQFGVLCVAAIMAGSISPPFAILAFTMHHLYPEVSLGAIFRASIPFLVTIIVSIVVFIFWPGISTFLVVHAPG
jgi:C4-dicarboxylate transporter DctM subunit